MSAATTHHTRLDESSNRKLFRIGFLAMLPLWAGAIPFGIAYSLTATQAGFSGIEAQLMSLTVFAAAAQISAVTLIDIGASTTEVLITAIGLNIHLPLFGAAIARETSLSVRSRISVASLLTDANFAVSAAQGPLRTPVLLGAGLCMYLGWNAGTAIGLLAGGAIPDPQQFAVDLVVPLTFLAVLTGMVRNRPALIVAISAAAGTLFLTMWLPIGIAILLSSVAASLIGVRLTPGSARSEHHPGDHS